MLRKHFASAMILSFGVGTSAYAQMPVCNGNGGTHIYSRGTGNILYKFDPAQPFSASNPSVTTIQGMATGGGLAVGPNLNAPSPAITFYTTSNGTYHYYDGSAWVNTNHTTGSLAAVNLATGGGYVYNLVGNSGEVYRYNGAANGTLVTTVPNFNGGGPFDMVADCAGNFYILELVNTQTLRQFSPSGVLLNTWNIVGSTPTGSGIGLALIGNRIYYQNGSGFWTGLITGSVITVSALAGTLQGDDFGSCPLGGDVEPAVKADKDTVYICKITDEPTVTATGVGPFVWSVLNGPAQIIGSGSSIKIKATGNAQILLKTGSGDCLGRDTVTVMVNADTAAFTFLTKYGCVSDTILFSNANTSQPISFWNFGDNTTTQGYNVQHSYANAGAYTVTLASGNTECNDTIRKTINVGHEVNASLIAPNSICNDDTAFFDGTSSSATLSPMQLYWSFGNGNGSTIPQVTHRYADAGTYQVKLIAVDSIGCADSASHTIVVKPLPFVELGPADTLLCNDVWLSLPRSLSNADSILWHNGSADIQYTAKHAGLIYVAISNDCGIAKDTISISYKDCSVYLPGAFSPNADGKNDLARILGNTPDIAECSFSIFNRFGEAVFSTTDKNAGWDGMLRGVPQPLGVYYYQVRYKMYGKDELLKGDITLVR